jgi:hypothetical protein
MKLLTFFQHVDSEVVDSEVIDSKILTKSKEKESK